MKIQTYLFTLLLILITPTAAANPDAIAESMELKLPAKGEPPATFVYAVQTGNLLFLSGHISVTSAGEVLTGKLGKDLTTEQGNAAARVAGTSILATIKQQLGSLSRVKKFVKVTGMVNASDDFTQHSQVINGFSDLMVEVFGEQGQHARSAVGMGSLPLNAAVEIEVIVEVQ